jgi:hypothetical protein
VSGLTSSVAGSVPGAVWATVISSVQTVALQTLAKNSTGSTALSRTACLVPSS